MNTKRYYKNIIALALITLGLLSSCSDKWFDTEIGARISPDQHYKSLDDVKLSYEGCFSFIQDIAEKQILVDGLRSDQMDITDNADKHLININMHNLTSENPYLDPSNYYKVIVNVNEVLPYLPGVKEIDRDFDSLQMAKYTGQLITLRSWAYFNLARLNGEVGFLNTDDPSLPPTYLGKTEAINQIISELKPFYDENDITRYDIDHNVLLGEMYLENDDYANAVKYLKFAIDGPYFPQRGRDGVFFMVDDEYQQAKWKNIFIDAQYQGTTVWSAVAHSYEQGQRNMIEEWMFKDYDFVVKPTQTIINAFNGNGGKADAYRGMGLSIDSTANGEFFISKYSQDIDVPHSADIILYRAADVHLLLAEALNRNGQPDLALALLNKGLGGLSNRPDEYDKWDENIGVRNRVKMSDRTSSDMLEIEEFIIEERASELAFEGKRWFDLVRIAERPDRGASFLADKVAAKFEDSETATEIRNKLMDEANWYLPIPR